MAFFSHGRDDFVYGGELTGMTRRLRELRGEQFFTTLTRRGERGERGGENRGVNNRRGRQASRQTLAKGINCNEARSLCVIGCVTNAR